MNPSQYLILGLQTDKGRVKEGRQAGYLVPQRWWPKTLPWGQAAASSGLRSVGGEVWWLGAHQGKPQGGKLSLSAKKNFLTV